MAVDIKKIAQSPKGAVVIYSGGMDSFTALNWAEENYNSVAALSFDYGQRHRKELEVAKVVCDTILIIPHKVVDLRSINFLLQGSSLTSFEVDVPEGHYAEENMKATVVPNRNMIMLSVAVGYAVSLGWQHVVCGAHAGDHDIYPDCRAEFFEALNEVTNIANYVPVSIDVPFINLSKGDILKEGEKLGLVAQDYVRTWTCYKGREQACGRCGACVERQEAFASVGWTDPLAYEDPLFWKAATQAKEA